MRGFWIRQNNHQLKDIRRAQAKRKAAAGISKQTEEEEANPFLAIP